jgi:hypothetical protein
MSRSIYATSIQPLNRSYAKHIGIDEPGEKLDVISRGAHAAFQRFVVALFWMPHFSPSSLDVRRSSWHSGWGALYERALDYIVARFSDICRDLESQRIYKPTRIGEHRGAPANHQSIALRPEVGQIQVPK